ncbi:MAG: UDP-N-acetylmuramoyl-L-alanyl-D-glutamate--2,6-diaminopimelate ligase [Thermodesulfobacteriota bacterium]|nr:UDP-N-acetylmuramoyl-L-alanyl-D-glutamate--2,6-diaminopimelate ligase [Thermodesulfobacteriota bacterium]
MRLSVLLQPVSPQRVIGPVPGNGGVVTDPEITSIHYRSDRVQPGGLFVAIRGAVRDGHDFIADALDRGAVAVVVDRPVSHPVIVAEVADTRAALAHLSARFYGYPARRLVMIGVTGTNGKTTTVALMERMLTAAGLETGVIGTENYRYLGRTLKNPLTTPESADLHRILKEMADACVTHVLMEVSSHALDQQRVAGVCFDVGVFTNLTRDHLDYHGDMDAYWACKKRLFTDHMGTDPGREAGKTVINCNDPHGAGLVRETLNAVCIPVGKKPDGVYAEDVRYAPEGLSGRIVMPNDTFSFTSPMVGHYSLENILCAVGGATALGLDGGAIQKGVNGFGGVPGRLERVPNRVQRFVFVDYAHTPDALENVLSTLKPISRGRLICVFGCGGDRDRSKRPIMGQIAVSLADRVVVTSDNPRSEDPGAIIREIEQGVRKYLERETDATETKTADGGSGYLIEPDRQRAIQAAVLGSARDDTILIAGKGSETYQILEDRAIDFDDRVEAGKALRELEKDQPAAMCAM